MMSSRNSLTYNCPPSQIGGHQVLVVKVNTLRSYTGVSGSHSAENAEAASKAYALGLNQVTIDDPGYTGTQISHVGTGLGAIQVIRRGSNPPAITVAVPGGIIFNGAINVPTIVHHIGIKQTQNCGHCGSNNHSSNQHKCGNCQRYGHRARSCTSHKGIHSSGYGGYGGSGGHGGSGSYGGHGGSGGHGSSGGYSGRSAQGGSSTVLNSGKLATFGMSHKSHGP